MKINKRKTITKEDAEIESMTEIIQALMIRKLTIEEWNYTATSIVEVMEELKDVDEDIDIERKELFKKQAKLLDELEDNISDIMKSFRKEIQSKVMNKKS